MNRVFIGDLPAVSVSRLRATGAITAEMTEFVVRLGEVEQTVSVTLRRLAHGGSWSLFTAPCCGRRARVLRLLYGKVVCKWCCFGCGVRYRCEPLGLRQRAEHRIPKLRAMVRSEQSLRLKPRLYLKMERRVRFKAALKRAELLVGYADFARET